MARKIFTALLACLLGLSSIGTSFAKSPHYDPSKLALAKQRYEQWVQRAKQAEIDVSKAEAFLLSQIRVNNGFLERHELFLIELKDKIKQAEQDLKGLKTLISDNTKAIEEKTNELSALNAELVLAKNWQHSVFSEDEKKRLAERLEKAKARLESQKTFLRARTKLYKENFLTYLEAYIHNGPRYLKSASIRVEDELLYQARFDPEGIVDDAPDISVMRRELIDIYQTIERRRVARAAAIEELKTQHGKIALAEAAFRAEINFKYFSIFGIEVALLIAEALSTGGAITLASNAAELTVKQVKNTIASNLKSQAAGKWGALVVTHKKAYDLPNKVGIGSLEGTGVDTAASTFLSEMVETGITTLGGTYFDYKTAFKEASEQTWTSWKDKLKNVRGNVKLTALEDLLEPKNVTKTIGVALGKSALLQYIENEFKQDEQRYLNLIIRTGYYISMLNVQAQVDREIERLRKQYESAIINYEAREKLADRATTLAYRKIEDKIFDPRIEKSTYQVQIDLVFSASLQFAPTVMFGETVSKNVKRLQGVGEFGEAWRATLELPEEAVEAFRKSHRGAVPLTVSIDKREVFDALDSEPETFALPLLKQEDWRFYQPGADQRHRLRLKEGQDLNGRWVVTGIAPGLENYLPSYVMRVIEYEDRIRIVYAQIPALLKRVCTHPGNRTVGCITEGQVFFEGKRLEGTQDDPTRFEGELFLDRRLKSCGVERATPAILEVSSNSEAVRLRLGEKFPQTANNHLDRTCPIREPAGDKLSGSSTLFLVRRGSPLAESQLGFWQNKIDGLQLSADQGATSSVFGSNNSILSTENISLTIFGGNNSFLSVSEREDLIGYAPNDGSKDSFWPVETLGPYLQNDIYDTLNEEEQKRAQRYLRDDVANIEGFPSTTIEFDASFEEVLASKGIEDIEELRRIILDQKAGSKTLPKPKNENSLEADLQPQIPKLAPVPKPIELAPAPLPALEFEPLPPQPIDGN